MALFDFIKAIVAAVGSLQRAVQTAQPDPQPTPPAPQPAPEPPAPQPSGSLRTGPSPDRYGTFIIPDVYPPDLDNPATPQLDLPPFQHLVGLTVSEKEVIGCYVKASEGLGWGARNEQWFRDCWRQMRQVGGDRYGVDWFRGCYHFLRFDQDGAAQADYCLNLIESAGGWDSGDLMLWVDVEEGGQGHWADDPKTHVHRKLEDIKDPAEKRRLAASITKCVTAFVSRVKARYPGMRVGVYGRGVFRDLGMTNARFGADAACNPAYTHDMPSMAQYGWPLEDIVEWQLCGDGEVYASGYPSQIPGWGRTDYSTVINGSRRVGLVDVRRRCLAKPR